MGIAAWLIIVLLIIMFMGHAMWVVVAWILRGCRPREDRVSLEPTISEDRAATARYLNRLQSCGLIDREIHAELTGIMAMDSGNDARGTVRRNLRAGNAGRDSGEIAHEDPWQRDREWREQQDAQRSRPPDRERQRLSESVPAESLPASAVALPAEVAPVDPVAQAVTPEMATEPAPTTEPRRPFAEMLLSFMAEKNIRWGELIGGLLILCCSTALVISLWSQIEAIPVLKFVIFTTVTAALFGVGFFVHHRWKLPTTGHALLIVASSLVPLNLLAFAALSRTTSGVSGRTLALELASMALFGWLLLLAGRILMPVGPKLFAFGVLVLSAISLVVRYAGPLGESAMLGLSFVPAGAYAAVMALSIRRAASDKWLTEMQVSRLFLQLGVQTFACAVPLGLLFFELGRIIQALHLFSPVVSLFAVPALVTGLFIVRRLAPGMPAQARTAALSISLIAAAIMLLGVGLAWPVPSRLLPALLVNGAAMVALGGLTRHPAIHTAAIVWFTAAWVLGVHLIGGVIAWSNDLPAAMLAALLSVRTGQVLVVPAIGCLMLAEWLGRGRSRFLARSYATTGVSVAAVSLLAVTWFGFAVPGGVSGAVWVYLLYSAVAFVLAWRLKTSLAGFAGCVLAQMAIVQMVVYGWGVTTFPWSTALLIGATACVAAVAVLRWRAIGQEVETLYAAPLGRFAVAVSILSAVGMILALSPTIVGAWSIRMFWLTGLWFVLAVANASPVVFAGGQLALIVAAAGATQHFLGKASWYASAGSAVGEPWVWQAHLLVAGGICLVFAVTRSLLTGGSVAITTGDGVSESQQAGYSIPSRPNQWVLGKLLEPGFPATDRLISGLGLLGLCVLSVWAVWPAVVMEHGPQPSPLGAGAHIHAAGMGSWAALLIITATLAAYVRQGRYLLWSGLGLLIVVACGTALLAARFEPYQSVTTSWRWLLAGVFLAGSTALWTRQYWISGLLRVIGGLLSETGPAEVALRRVEVLPRMPSPQAVARCLALLFALPAMVLTMTFALAIGTHGALVPPDGAEVWLRISLLGPGALVVITLIGYAILDRQPAFAVGAAALACVMVTATELALAGRAGRALSFGFLLTLLQLNAIVSAGIGLIWHVVAGVVNGDSVSALYPRWPLTIFRGALAMVFAALIAAAWFQPQTPPSSAAAAASIWGMLAVVLIEVSLLRACPPSLHQEGHRETLWLLFGVSLTAFALVPFDTGNWICFHALMVGFVVAAGVRLYISNLHVWRLLGAGWRESLDAHRAELAADQKETIEHDLTCTSCGYNLRSLPRASVCPECGRPVAESVQAAVTRFSSDHAARITRLRTHAVGAVLGFAILGTTFALRAAFDGPHRPWWSAGVLVVLSGLSMALAAWAPKRPLAYLGGLQLCVGASIWWAALYGSPVTSSLADLVSVNIIALSIAAMAWLVIERKVLMRLGGIAEVGWRLPFHHAAAVLATSGVVGLALMATLQAVAGEQPVAHPLGVVLGWVVSLGLAIACFRESAARFAPAWLYTLGLAALLQILARSGMSPRTLGAAISVGLAGYVVAVLVVRAAWSRYTRQPETHGPVPPWLMNANVLLACVSLGLAFFISVTDIEPGRRGLVVLSPFLLMGAALLPSGAMVIGIAQTVALGLGGTTLVLLAWTWISPDMPAPLLHRSVGAIAAIVAGLVGSVAARPWLSDGTAWAGALRRYVIGSFTVGTAALLYCCFIHAWALLGGKAVPMVATAVTLTVISLAAVTILCIVLAASPRFDPLGLSSEARGGYIYAAQILGGVLALHVRATMPWLFTGFVTQYWPLLVMSIAFAAVTAGEALDRWGQRIIGLPFSRTGTFLPLLAVLELFIHASRVHYSIVLLVVGAFYAVLSAIRRSAALSLAAAAAFNGSLWYLLHHTPGLGITHHPQLWFIPPALAVLAAGHLNRRRLNPAQLRAVHYGCLLAIYLSSTADIFLIGVARAPWLPLVLGALSVAGVFAGVASRIRSFLLCGTGFLCLSLLTMIWHAATNLGWTWVWYVAGIALGIAIITVFALFERKREEMRALVGQIKTWAE